MISEAMEFVKILPVYCRNVVAKQTMHIDTWSR